MAQSADSPEPSRKRTWLAVVLSVFPGLGHVYLRLWRRAVLWLGLSGLSWYLFVPDGIVPDTASIGAILSAVQLLLTDAAAVLFGVSMLCVVDAYLMAQHLNTHIDRVKSDSEEVRKRCPNCGKTLDQEIDFCHWCTTELDETEL